METLGELAEAKDYNLGDLTVWLRIGKDGLQHTSAKCTRATLAPHVSIKLCPTCAQSTRVKLGRGARSFSIKEISQLRDAFMSRADEPKTMLEAYQQLRQLNLEMGRRSGKLAGVYYDTRIEIALEGWFKKHEEETAKLYQRTVRQGRKLPPDTLYEYLAEKLLSGQGWVRAIPTTRQGREAQRKLQEAQRKILSELAKDDTLYILDPHWGMFSKDEALLDLLGDPKSGMLIGNALLAEHVGQRARRLKVAKGTPISVIETACRLYDPQSEYNTLTKAMQAARKL